MLTKPPAPGGVSSIKPVTLKRPSVCESSSRLLSKCTASNSFSKLGCAVIPTRSVPSGSGSVQ